MDWVEHHFPCLEDVWLSCSDFVRYHSTLGCSKGLALVFHLVGTDLLLKHAQLIHGNVVSALDFVIVSFDLAKSKQVWRLRSQNWMSVVQALNGLREGFCNQSFFFTVRTGGLGLLVLDGGGLETEDSLRNNTLLSWKRNILVVLRLFRRCI